MNKSLVDSILITAMEFAYRNSDEHSNNFQNIFTYKFAELLVDECAKVCINFKFSDQGPSENASYQRALCSEAIKEHFFLTSSGPIKIKKIR